MQVCSLVPARVRWPTDDVSATSICLLLSDRPCLLRGSAIDGDCLIALPLGPLYFSSPAIRRRRSPAVSSPRPESSSQSEEFGCNPWAARGRRRRRLRQRDGSHRNMHATTFSGSRAAIVRARFSSVTDAWSQLASLARIGQCGDRRSIACRNTKIIAHLPHLRHPDGADYGRPALRS
jgi:hypothetical protein